MSCKRYRGVLCIDFDGTIAVTDWPKIKGTVTSAKKYINKLYREGWYILIWTCRSGQHLQDAKDFLDKEGILYHGINEQNNMLVKRFGETRKLSADFYIDDKNIFGLPAWSKIYSHLMTLPKSFKSCLTVCYEDEWE